MCHGCAKTWLYTKQVSDAGPAQTKKDVHGNHVATCPTCRALYREGATSKTHEASAAISTYESVPESDLVTFKTPAFNAANNHLASIFDSATTRSISGFPIDEISVPGEDATPEFIRRIRLSGCVSTMYWYECMDFINSSGFQRLGTFYIGANA